jgi:lipopolysaccharide/colanic/teichoic acid biosynthesis glycosyltransferase
MQAPISARREPEYIEEFEPITPNTNIGYRLVKRLFDIVVSAIALVVFSPLFLIVAIIIKVDDPKGSVIYSQLRTGLNGVSFKFYKFRSMVSNADELKFKLMALNEMDGPVFKIQNDPRVTKIGRFIRRTSIDELPQILNVLKGDMSIVGPRPLPVQEEMACTPYQRQREVVVPGITCSWQASGRNKLLFDQWVDMDLKYIQEQNLLLDLKLILKTVPAVVKRDGAA